MGRDLFLTKSFQEKFHYPGDDLGFIYSSEITRFRVWAPYAQQVELLLYQNGDCNDSKAETTQSMTKAEKGTWTTSVMRDLEGMFYTYRVKNPDLEPFEVGDPYAKAAGVNGKRSAVVELNKTNPENWETDERPFFSNATDCVIYELHVRDLSSSKDSGVSNVGKFLAFTEHVPKGEQGISRGIDHIVELGATHVHLLPAFDFATVDESISHNNAFNWGYDPENYNVPEGSYATDANNPHVRIREFKEMVKAMHNKGLRVVMDVVYNHTLENVNSKFHRLVPGYYYRMYPDGTFMNGSYCNSETASERSMMRKYIVDSVKYWAQEYHVDGFRFDLMGLHDITTMNEVRTVLHEIDETILIYGEGWDMGNLPKKQRAIQKHAASMMGIGFFNDHIRDCLKGPFSDVKGHGFVDGCKKQERNIMRGVCGSIYYDDMIKDYNSEPGQSINYVEAHDNNTLWDKLVLANGQMEEAALIKMDLLAAAVMLTSQGVPFLSSGMEFLRTKGGDENSFLSPDSVNMLDWSRKVKYQNVFQYYKGLIQLRKGHAAFRMPEAAMIREHLVFLKVPDNMVAYVLKNHANEDTWTTILVVYNANKIERKISIPKAQWNVVVKDGVAGIDTIETVSNDEVIVPPISTLVMYTQKSILN